MFFLKIKISSYFKLPIDELQIDAVDVLRTALLLHAYVKAIYAGGGGEVARNINSLSANVI